MSEKANNKSVNIAKSQLLVHGLYQANKTLTNVFCHPAAGCVLHTCRFLNALSAPDVILPSNQSTGLS
jgi:hypothetical protein